MQSRSVEAIIRALNEANVRYLVVGGLAVVANGYVRFTRDVDLVLDPDGDSRLRAVRALQSLGYRPLVPVPFEAFADASQRASWMREKGQTVFNCHSDEHPWTTVDLFVEPPFDFESHYSRAARLAVTTGLEATFVSRLDLIAMKREVGRPLDLVDATQLEQLERLDSSGE